VLVGWLVFFTDAMKLMFHTHLAFVQRPKRSTSNTAFPTNLVYLTEDQLKQCKVVSRQYLYDSRDQVRRALRSSALTFRLWLIIIPRWLHRKAVLGEAKLRRVNSQCSPRDLNRAREIASGYIQQLDNTTSFSTSLQRWRFKSTRFCSRLLGKVSVFQ